MAIRLFDEEDVDVCAGGVVWWKESRAWNARMPLECRNNTSNIYDDNR